MPHYPDHQQRAKFPNNVIHLKKFESDIFRAIQAKLFADLILFNTFTSYRTYSQDNLQTCTLFHKVRSLGRTSQHGVRLQVY